MEGISTERMACEIASTLYQHFNEGTISRREIQKMAPKLNSYLKAPGYWGGEDGRLLQGYCNCCCRTLTGTDYAVINSNSVTSSDDREFWEFDIEVTDALPYGRMADVVFLCRPCYNVIRNIYEENAGTIPRVKLEKTLEKVGLVSEGDYWIED